MRSLTAQFILITISAFPAAAKAVVFWQPGFPTVSSQPVARETLAKAFEGMGPVFSDLDRLEDPAALSGADLLVLPYGSAAPADAWSAIMAYLRSGGNLLVLGGQPLRVPVSRIDGKFVEGPPQDSYARDLNLQHTYAVPNPQGARFVWRAGYSFLPTLEVRARRFFAVEGRLSGLGYMVIADGVEVAAPVIVVDHRAPARPGCEGGGRGGAGMVPGGRIVMLDFEPEPGYWASVDGVSLIRQSADYARQGATEFSLELPFSTVKPGETPQVIVHLRNAQRERLGVPLAGEVKIETLSGDRVLETQRVAVAAGQEMRADLPPQTHGFFTVRGVYEEGGRPREFHQNAFWVEDSSLLTSGPVLGVAGDFLNRDGTPFFAMGTNYFTTQEDGWDFAGPRNAWTWEKDFAEMSRHGVNFVRTGVWMPSLAFLDPDSGAAPERFLRNLEAYLLCARRHNIVVNFTFYAFMPRPGMGLTKAPPERGCGAAPAEPAAAVAPPPGPGPNPYLDPAAIRAELNYVRSVVERFKNVPWLCWDLINEPSFSNPDRLWKGNTPNGDPVELAAWQKWLARKYGSLAALASAWAVTPERLKSFDAVPLPAQAELAFSRYGVPREVRALDYNLFAQDSFTEWVRTMVTNIRGTGSKQLVNVGQDEGGVTDRLLNQFYASGGVSFTTNHTYWHDDALLWDSVAAKRPGVPNIVGETGYQPVWSTDGSWRYDELTGFPLLERKWALGFAAANSGAVQWDWAREVDFGMKRSDGSAKLWQAMMGEMGQFAEKAAPWASGLVQPQVAIVLPQSLQLSVLNANALEAQQKCVRALYQYARAEAYAVGEYQIELLGNPKLIILPAPRGLTRESWEAIRGKVEAGATLLVSGAFDGDPSFHPAGRQDAIGLPFQPGPLTLRETLLQWPDHQARLTFGEDKTTFLDRAVLPDGGTWAEKPLGKGRILFSALPLELNDNVQAIGDVYRYALKMAGVAPTYSTTVADPGILICPTRYPQATLYVLTSEAPGQEVTFRDGASGKTFRGKLDAGRAALLLVGADGSLLATYNWP
ncbi:MAG TPA: beta-galactosidase [Bryobacteraceae bacterium]